MNRVRKAHSRYSTGINASTGGIGRSAGFNQATDKTLAILPTDLTIEIYRRPDGTTQCNWFPQRPNLKHVTVRNKVIPHYATAMEAYAEQFGNPGHVHGSAYDYGTNA
ncbi:hypothetical protein ACQZ6H_10665 [Agrobacterium fabrum]|uniref:hypothetical protein n=1 Tax=Agrobacterium fabrum TaxID=1176649 RepID=UPI0015746796|nr:hypothetical protein [Agrobacterium fabrum]WIE26432.1 hypothetical protein G6L42_008395 [Agrobacterium fabrum]WIE42389.1 hypothetical protein G6L76_008395 [Agrobacterium fabrum]